ncbi:MAG: metal-dependent hydrolase [Bacteroidetes bacterium]|nr:metal-dependent hydrolase [Bacteroidota bacterium]
MKFTYYGHACFAIEVAGKHLLFDPFITGNPLVKGFDINTIKADYILQSHGHGDHIADLIPIAKNTGATVIGVAEVIGWVMKQGHDKVHPMNYGAFDFEFGNVRMVPAAHSSGLPDGSYGGNPGGFVITTAEGVFYYSGDTCLSMEMQLIPRYAAGLKFAILPVGGNYTMNPDDALIATEFIKCDKVVGVHFNTWPPITIDEVHAKRIFEAAGKELILPEIGQTIEL